MLQNNIVIGAWQLYIKLPPLVGWVGDEPTSCLLDDVKRIIFFFKINIAWCVVLSMVVVVINLISPLAVLPVICV